MIKGQNISELLIIKDNSTGAISLWIMIIMLFGIYILYNAAYLLWCNKTIRKLYGYEEILKKGKRKSAITDVVQKSPVKKTQAVVKNNDCEEKIKEDMEVYNNLKRKRKW